MIMPCLGCFRYDSTNLPQPRQRVSSYSIVGEPDEHESRKRNLINVKLQMELTEELSESTYGLAVEGATDKPYEAQDFFIFKEIMGSGATGVVFRAIFKPTSEVYAVKFIPHFKQSRVMAMRELHILRLSDKCKQLINFHSHFRVGRNLYFVIELCEGGNLEELLHPKSCVPPKLSRVYLKELAIALFFLHRMKVVHRDVALPNCLLTKRAHLKLGDFGLCRTVEEPNGEVMTDCGKPAIRAPEMYLDKHCSFGIDWWAFGIILYRFITGYYPFQTDKLTEGFQSVTKLKEKYPEWLFDDPDATSLCQKLLIKNPKHRLAYANETFEIKSHPFFFGLDWQGEEDIEHVLELDMKGEIDRYMPVFKNVSKILGISTALDLNTTRSSAMNIKAYKGGLRENLTKFLSNTPQIMDVGEAQLKTPLLAVETTV